MPMFERILHESAHGQVSGRVGVAYGLASGVGVRMSYRICGVEVYVSVLKLQ